MSECLSCVAIAPNNYRRYMNDIVPDSKFNWFLCGVRVYDENTKLYLLEVPSGVRFYSPNNGESYRSKSVKDNIESKSSEKVLKLFIANEQENINNLRDFNEDFIINDNVLDLSSGIFNKMDLFVNLLYDKYKYDGVAVVHNCRENSTLSSPMCSESSFYFKKDSVHINVDERCELISFCKKYNKSIRSKIEEFPTCEEIESVLAKHKREAVCRVLYNYVLSYLKLL